MTHDRHTSAQHKHRARLLEALVVGAVLAFVLWAAVSDAAAYNHVRACQISMNGGHHSDPDIQNVKNATGARGFDWERRLNGSWRAWHARDGSVYMIGDFLYSNGAFRRVKAHCWRRDYGPDHFVRR